MHLSSLLKDIFSFIVLFSFHLPSSELKLKLKTCHKSREGKQVLNQNGNKKDENMQQRKIFELKEILELSNCSGDKDSSLSNIYKNENNVDSENDDVFLTWYENDGNFIS